MRILHDLNGPPKDSLFKVTARFSQSIAIVEAAEASSNVGSCVNPTLAKECDKHVSSELVEEAISEQEDEGLKVLICNSS